ncbi:peptide cleavage/export ABC transporter [Streptococcus gordonii]|uniref:peptide cleavage/export ABC transporter n=1 Tax=Streptococcus gordonii TaxID=1302 RepID=UPI00189B4BAA|nr:peptide cleavage/export ABC transporter [Streptococcus gordonii]
MFGIKKVRINSILQQNAKDCGVAVIKAILKYYGSEVPFNMIREITETSNEGTSINGIKKCFNRFNLDCVVVEADETAWDYKIVEFPIIAHLLIDSSYPHYVIVYGRSKNKLFISDPSKGKYKIEISAFLKIWTGLLILAEPNEYYKVQKIKTKGLLSFIHIIFQFKKSMILVFFFSLIITCIGIIGAFYYNILIDRLIPQKVLNQVNIISISLVLFYAFKFFIEYIKNNILVFLGQQMNFRLVSDYFNHVIKLPMSFFKSRQTGDIVSRFIDANKIIDALASASLSILLDGTSLIIIGIVLFIKNRYLFLVTFFVIPIYFVVILYFSRKIENYNNELMDASSNLNSSIIESLRGIESIKACKNEKIIHSKITKELNNVIKKMRKLGNIENSQFSIKGAIDAILNTIIVWGGSYFVITSLISLGDLITYVSLLVYFTSPLQNIANLQVKLQAAEVASQRLNEILEIESEDLTQNNNFKIESQFKTLKIANLNFSYNTSNEILNNIHLEIEKGDKVSLIGLSGSGKSTLAQIMVRFLYPSSGDIFLNNISIGRWSIPALREMIYYVPQEPYIFSGSVWENLVFGNNEAIKKESVYQACKKARILSYIESLPLSFDTLIEEGGANLSGGQKKRLLIARALLSNSQFYIFDEVTNGMDSLLESKIINELIELEEKTIVFITHNLQIAKQCDKIILLDKGEVIEIGTHEELMKNNRLYSNMFNASV